MITALLIAIASQLPYADYIGDPVPPRRTARGAAEPFPKPAPLPAPPPSLSLAREAGRRVSDGENRAQVPPAGTQWYSLTTHPGYEGYGALNARGEVVVEWHRRAGSSDIRPGRVPDAAHAVTAIPSCANGQCAAPGYPGRRGLLWTR